MQGLNVASFALEIDKHTGNLQTSTQLQLGQEIQTSCIIILVHNNTAVNIMTILICPNYGSHAANGLQMSLVTEVKLLKACSSIYAVFFPLKYSASSIICQYIQRTYQVCKQWQIKQIQIKLIRSKRLAIKALQVLSLILYIVLERSMKTYRWDLWVLKESICHLGP